MRIYVTGPAWSGKSTIAKRLGERLGIPVVHLDDLLWNPDWTENADYGKLQKEAIGMPNWIIEWPSCSIVKSMHGIDRIIVLDYPPLGNAFRILARHVKSKYFCEARIGMKMPDRLNLGLISKTFAWRKRQLPRLLENIRLAGLENSIKWVLTWHLLCETYSKNQFSLTLY